MESFDYKGKPYEFDPDSKIRFELYNAHRLVHAVTADDIHPYVRYEEVKGQMVEVDRIDKWHVLKRLRAKAMFSIRDDFESMGDVYIAERIIFDRGLEG